MAERTVRSRRGTTTRSTATSAAGSHDSTNVHHPRETGADVPSPRGIARCGAATPAGLGQARRPMPPAGLRRPPPPMAQVPELAEAAAVGVHRAVDVPAVAQQRAGLGAADEARLGGAGPLDQRQLPVDQGSVHDAHAGERRPEACQLRWHSRAHGRRTGGSPSPLPSRLVIAARTTACPKTVSGADGARGPHPTPRLIDHLVPCQSFHAWPTSKDRPGSARLRLEPGACSRSNHQTHRGRDKAAGSRLTGAPARRIRERGPALIGLPAEPGDAALPVESGGTAKRAEPAPGPGTSPL